MLWFICFCKGWELFQCDNSQEQDICTRGRTDLSKFISDIFTGFFAPGFDLLFKLLVGFQWFTSENRFNINLRLSLHKTDWKQAEEQGYSTTAVSGHDELTAAVQGDAPVG